LSYIKPSTSLRLLKWPHPRMKSPEHRGSGPQRAGKHWQNGEFTLLSTRWRCENEFRNYALKWE